MRHSSGDVFFWALISMMTCPTCLVLLQDPYLAVVVDPVRTMASGKVEIGAFRTYPEGYK
jgi:hypothetical protein